MKGREGEEWRRGKGRSEGEGIRGGKGRSGGGMGGVKERE